MTFEQLLELELQKEGDIDLQKEKTKPKKTFLKKGKLIKEIYKTDNEQNKNQNRKSVSPTRITEEQEHNEDSPKNIIKKPFLKKGKMIREI